MTPAIVTLEPHTPGDTWQGIPTIGPIQMSVDSGPLVAMSAPIASARLHWSKGVAYPVVAKFSTAPADGESPIALVNAATWELSVPPVAPADFLLTEGNWFGHLEITDTDGTVWTTHTCLMVVGVDYTK